MPKYECTLCGSVVEKEVEVLHDVIDEWMVKMILADYPHWKESDGACRKCREEIKKRYKEANDMKIFPGKKLNYE